MADKLKCGAAQSKRVDSPMLPETLILISNQHTDKLRIHIPCGCTQPPAAFRRGEGTQQLSIGVQHFSRNLARLVQGRRKGAIGSVKTKGKHGGQNQIGRDTDAEGSPREHYCAETTSMRPVAVRAENCGRYMSSTLAAG